MEEMPEEILLQILSSVQHGPTLVDSVPLVCQRWLRLSRDPRVWAGVRLEVVCDRKGGVPVEAARALLHAPLLRAVVLSWCSSHPAALETRPLEASLKRSTARVHQLDIQKFCRMYPGTRQSLGAAVISFMRRVRPQLRAVAATLVPNAFGAQPQRVFDSIVTLHAVEELDLDFHSSSWRYFGKAHRVFCELRRLRLGVSRLWKGPVTSDQYDQVALLRDLLDGCVRTLRHLELPPCLKLVQLRDRLGSCTELRTLRAHWTALPSLRSLRQLRELTLTALGDQTQMADGEELLPCGGLPNLTSLEVETVGEVDKELLVALGRAAPNATSLRITIHNQRPVEVVGELVSVMPQLVRLSVGPFCDFAALKEVMLLEHLRTFEAEVRCAREEVTPCHSALTEFRDMRPHLEASICLTMASPNLISW